MWLGKKLFVSAFAAGILLAGSNVIAQNDSDVVAQVGDIKVTRADLNKEEEGKLLQARYQYYQTESKALDELVGEKLLEVKAKQENLTVEQLMDRDIKSKIQDPTDDQMRVFYEGLETEQPYEAVRDKILAKIRQVRTQRATAEYVKKLREQISVVIELAPPNANVDLKNATFRGPQNAPVTLVEFADYECPYCQKVAPEINQLQADMGNKVSIVYKDFPLPMHSHAEKAAEAARCAGKQGKFWEYHDMLFHSKQLEVDQLKEQAAALKLDTASFNKCLDSGEEAADVARDRSEGQKLGLNGTPSFFVNGHFFSGDVDYNGLRRIVEQQLSEGSTKVAMNTSK